MPDVNRCSFAAQVVDLVTDRPRTLPVWGLVVHTSGRSIVERALARGEDVLEHCVAYYRAAPYSAHYVGGWDGELVQLTPDDRRVPHVGVSAEERKLYLSAAWTRDQRLNSAAVGRWLEWWYQKGRVRSPQHLFPGTSANGAYVGLELPPLRLPNPDGLWYTRAQHELVARLAADLRRRHGWPAWPKQLPCARLLGHEDLDAFGRWDRGGGWDPGALRAEPRFDWGLVAEMLRGL